MVLTSAPMPSISVTTSSPGWQSTTPSGVPVRIRSPGDSVMKRLKYSIRKGASKIMSRVLPCCVTWPLTVVRSASAIGSATSFASTSQGPIGVQFMHYECELAIVIGKTARHVKRDDAYDFIGGYTVANDYAIRDYLENWYRPNLRVKNRDTCTPIGPWPVSYTHLTLPTKA